MPPDDNRLLPVIHLPDGATPLIIQTIAVVICGFDGRRGRRPCMSPQLVTRQAILLAGTLALCGTIQYHSTSALQQAPARHA